MLLLVGIKQSVYVHRLHCLPPSLFPDNELPDYTMVMLANSKILMQVLPISGGQHRQVSLSV